MSSSIRQSIMDNIVTRLKAISTMSGYYADYQFCDEWVLSALTEEELPAIVCRDESEDVLDYQFDKIVDWALHVTVSILVREDTAPTTLRNYIQDIYRCIGSDLLCGGYATGIKPTGDTITMEQEDSVYGVIDVNFDILYSSEAWDSTALA